MAEGMGGGGAGRLTVITGPMFGGKSEALIAMASEARRRLGPGRVAVLAPAADTRAPGGVASRAGTRMRCRRFDGVPSAKAGVVEAYVDELHLAEAGAGADAVAAAVLRMTARGVDVAVAGLDLDSDRRPFASVALLCVRADRVVRLEARCHACGAPAPFTERTSRGAGRFLVGDAEAYRPACGACWGGRRGGAAT